MNSLRYPLNGLRGFAAIMVVFYHVTALDAYLDPSYVPSINHFFVDKSKIRVLLFFIISGVVISLSNKNGLSLQTVPSYLKKRFLRLYPMYFSSLIFALLIAGTAYPNSVIIGNFLFMQVLFTNVILENGPIWTLHYEVIFYLLFIPISLFNLDPVKLVIGSILVAFINYLFVYPALNWPIVTSYGLGFAFWSLGMIVVKKFKINYKSITMSPALLSCLFLLIAISNLNFFQQYAYDISYRHLGHEFGFPSESDINDWFPKAFSFYTLAYLPYCFFAVSLFLGIQFKGDQYFRWCLQLLPLVYMLNHYRMYGQFDGYTFVFPSLCYFVSCVLLVVNHPYVKALNKRVINLLIDLGGISYGIYIIHAPLLILFSQITFFQGTAGSYSVRLVLYVIILLVMAYFLEKIVQPRVVSLFAAKKETVATRV